MWHEFAPVFVIDIEIFGCCVGPYVVASVIGLSWIWPFAHVEPSFAAAVGAAEAGVVAADAGAVAAAVAAAVGALDGAGVADAVCFGCATADAEVVGAAEDAPPPWPTTMSTITTMTTTTAAPTHARRRQ
jgi:hypothetical protein